MTDVTVGDKTLTIAEWSKILKVNSRTIFTKWCNGEFTEEFVAKRMRVNPKNNIVNNQLYDDIVSGKVNVKLCPDYKTIRFDMDGNILSLIEMADMLGIPRPTVQRRYYLKKSILEILNPICPDDEFVGDYEVMFCGEIISLTELSSRTRLGRPLLRNRIADKATLEHLVSPTDESRLTIDGITRTVSEWANIAEISSNTIYRRIRVGYSNHELLVKRLVSSPSDSKGEIV